MCNDVGICCEDWTPELSRARRSMCFGIRLLCVTYLSLVLYCFIIYYLYFEYMRIKIRFKVWLGFCHISLFWFTDCLLPWIQWWRDKSTMKGKTNCKLQRLTLNSFYFPFNFNLTDFNINIFMNTFIISSTIACIDSNMVKMHNKEILQILWDVMILIHIGTKL